MIPDIAEQITIVTAMADSLVSIADPEAVDYDGLHAQMSALLPADEAEDPYPDLREIKQAFIASLASARTVCEEERQRADAISEQPDWAATNAMIGNARENLIDLINAAEELL